MQAHELVIRFRKRGQVVRIGAESFFFQEGQADVYALAKYGELKVAKDGEVVLVGLRDAERKVLGTRASYFNSPSPNRVVALGTQAPPPSP